MKSQIENIFGADDFEEIYIEGRMNREKKKRHEKQKRTRENGIDVTFDRPLFSTQHSLRQQKKKNLSPLEVVVPYTRARKERFYYWPPYSLLPSKCQTRNRENLSVENQTVDKKSQ